MFEYDVHRRLFSANPATTGPPRLEPWRPFCTSEAAVKTRRSMLTKKGFLAPLVLVITTFGCLFGQTCERAVTLTGIYSETQVPSQGFIVDLHGEPLTVSRVEPIAK